MKDKVHVGALFHNVRESTGLRGHICAHPNTKTARYATHTLPKGTLSECLFFFGMYSLLTTEATVL